MRTVLVRMLLGVAMQVIASELADDNGGTHAPGDALLHRFTNKSWDVEATPFRNMEYRVLMGTSSPHVDLDSTILSKQSIMARSLKSNVLLTGHKVLSRQLEIPLNSRTLLPEHGARPWFRVQAHDRPGPGPELELEPEASQIQSQSEDRTNVQYLLNAMELAVKREDYSEAGRLKKLIDAASSNVAPNSATKSPPPDRKYLQRALHMAVAREDYAEAARLAAELQATKNYDDSKPAAYSDDVDLVGTSTAAIQTASKRQSVDSSISAIPSAELNPSLLWKRISELEAKNNVPERVRGGCHCGAEVRFEDHCGVLHSDAAAAAAASALETHLARYAAFCEVSLKFQKSKKEKAANYIMSTTHRNNSEYQQHPLAWRTKILDFCRTCRFVDFKVLRVLHFHTSEAGLIPADYVQEEPGQAHDGDHTYITWKARIKLLDGIIDNTAFGTTDFLERSIFVREAGRWLYLGGDPDFEPRETSVSGPFDQPTGGGGGGKGGQRVAVRVGKRSIVSPR